MKRFLLITILMIGTLNLFACGSPSFYSDQSGTPDTIDSSPQTSVTYADSIDDKWYLGKEGKYISIKCDDNGYPIHMGISADNTVGVEGSDTTLKYRFISKKRYTDTSSILKFSLNERETVIVSPDNPLEGNPTVWRTEFFEAFDTVDKALLEKGWHIVYHTVSNMYGAPKSLKYMHEFQNFATIAFGLSRKPVLFGFSRGGLYAVNYAAEYPDCVGGIYLDAPVQDIRDWPCRDDMIGTLDRRICMYLYGLTDETLPSFDGNPIDKAKEIADIPLIIVAGLADTTVLWERNGAIMADRVLTEGGNVEVILKEDCEHHPHSLEDPTPIVEFIEKYCV